MDHSPGPGYAAVHFNREGFTWEGDKAQHPVPYLVTEWTVRLHLTSNPWAWQLAHMVLTNWATSSHLISVIWYYCFDSFLSIGVLWEFRTSLDLGRSCAEKLHSSVLSSCSFRAMTLVLQSLARSFVKRSSTSLMVGKSLPTPRKWPVQEKVYSSPVSSRVIVLHHWILASVVWISGLQIVLPLVLSIWLCDSVMDT